MSRKRKSQNNLYNVVKRPVLPALRILGNRVGHPIIIQDTEIKNLKGNSKNLDVMKIICFAGIPACCLSARGSGPNSGIAEESAAHAMLDFFRNVMHWDNITKLYSAEPTPAILESFLPIFKAFEDKINDNKTLLDRCGQFEMTSATLVRGREVRRQIIKKINEERKKESTSEVVADELNGDNGNDSDVMIIDEPIKKDDDIDNCFDDVVILEDSPISYEQSKAIEEMRTGDAVSRQEACERIARQMTRRRSMLGSRSNDVDFGELNNSGTGPSEVFCCIPNLTGTQFSEDLSSDSEGEVCKKRPRLFSDTDAVVVHTTSAIKKKTLKESDDEIGEIIDEWNETDDSSRKNSSERSKRAVTTTETYEKASTIYNGSTTSNYSFSKTGNPKHLQMKMLGVIANENLSIVVESHIQAVSCRSLDSIYRLSKLAWDHYINNSQPESVYDRKMRARQMLFEEIQKLFHDKHVSLQVTGSTINGCGSYNSDVDMCLCYPTNGIRGQTFNDFQCERNFSLRILRKIDKTFKRLPRGHQFKKFVDQCDLIPAKVPIIKLLLNGIYAGIDIDINVNNIAGIYNSHLTHYYSLTDARFPALSLVVKHWAMRTGINNSPDGFLNSYTIILMVLHYLQCGVRPAVLPNLQYLFPDKFDRKLPLEELLLFGDIAKKLPATPPNKSSMGELIIGFFNYYSLFDFDRNAISIRSAQVISRDCLPHDTKRFPMFVEEPFDAINTARSVRTSSHMNTIKSAFRSASEVFLKEVFDISDLGVVVVPRSDNLS